MQSMRNSIKKQVVMAPQTSKTRTRTLLISGIILLSMLLVSGASCQQQTPQAPTPAPVPTPGPGLPPAPNPPPPEPSITWSADGILDTEEYLSEMQYGDYEIRWISDAQHIYIGIRAKTTGFVALGIKPTTAMKDADMVFGFVKDGETTVYDLFSTGNFGPHPPDTELGGSDDILEFGGKEENGFTTIEFKRALDTGDQYDKPLTEGVNNIIWSYGGSDGLTIKHSKRGTGEIQL